MKNDITLEKIRNGFTLVELLVVIAIIGMLVAILLPAVNAARGAARRAQCLNNMRQVQLAAINYSTSHGDQIPGYGKYTQIFPNNNRNASPHQIQCMPGQSWVVTLLPYMDQNPLADQWRTGSFLDPANQQLATHKIDIVVCPSDTTSIRGGLSYVINSGFADMSILDEYAGVMSAGNIPVETQMHAHNMLQFDWDDDNRTTGFDQTVTRDTGVSWVHVGRDNFSHRIGQIYDGSSNTILFGENINAGMGGNWANPAIQNCAFVYPVYRSRAGASNFANPPTPAGLSGLPNKDRNRGEGTPFLAADHNGTVNVAMVGGSVHSMPTDIDPFVYRALLTPAGAKRRHAQFANERPLTSNPF